MFEILLFARLEEIDKETADYLCAIFTTYSGIANSLAFYLAPGHKASLKV